MIAPLSDKRRQQLREASKRWQQRHPETVKARKQAYKEANPEKVKFSQKLTNQKQREKNKELYALSNKLWREENKEYVAHKNALRRQRSKTQTPMWDAEFTEFVYKEALQLAKARKSLFGFLWHVDHIVPLKGTNVSGLHVWNNFAVIPAKLNMSKHNTFTGDTSWL
jgi:hypothetical protein